MSAGRWVMAGVAVLLAVASGYFAATNERAVFECTACLATDRARCASSSETPGAEFNDDVAARAAAVENLCAALGEDVAACARSPEKRFLTGCTSSVRRVMRPLFHVE